MTTASDIAAAGAIGNALRPASLAGSPAEPLIAPTGSPGLNSVIDVVNNTAAPFMNAPSPEGGAAGALAQGLGGVMGVIGAPQMIIDTGFAALTAPIAAALPSLPAVTLLGMHIGPPHAHSHPPSLIPPAPPVPLPSIGCLVGAGSVTVLVGGMPAARAGDIGISVTCGSLAPPFELYTGSSNVFIGGARAARTLDITKHCNPTAMGPFAIAMGAAGAVAAGAGAVASGSGYMAAQAGADAAVLALKLLCGKDPGIPPGMGVLVGPPVPNVLIGGFPCPPLGEMAWGGILKALGKASRAVRGRLSRRANGCCGNGGEPIYVVTGENFNSYVDFVSGGLFEWRRHYTSARHRSDSPIGYGWRHFYQRTLSVRLNSATFTDWDGLQTRFPRFERGSDTTRWEGYVLRRVSRGHYRLSYRSEPTMEFEGDQFRGELKLRRIVSKEGELEFEYDELGRVAIAVERSRKTREKRRFELRYDVQGHIEHVLELQPPAQASKTTGPTLRAAYRYASSGDLLQVQDALSGISSFECDAFHRMTRQEDARGYAFTYKYNAFGQCIETSGQDGLWATTIEYFSDNRYTRVTEGGAVWEFHYDSDGVITKVIDPYGGVLRRERDAEGRMAVEIDAAGREMRWLFDADGAHYARMDRFGHLFPPEVEMPIVPNPFVRRLPSTSAEWLLGSALKSARSSDRPSQSALFSDVPFNLRAQFQTYLRSAVTPRRGSRETLTTGGPQIEKDALGRKIREVDELGRCRQWEYDATGNLVAERDLDGQTVRQATTSWNLLGQRRNALDHIVRYEYSPLEEVVAIADPLGNESRYEYDQCKRLTRVHRHGRIREEYIYDQNGNFVEKRDGAGLVLFRNENHENCLVSTRHLTSGGIHHFDYDKQGRIIEASTECHLVQAVYDNGGLRLKDVRDGLGIERRRETDHWVTEVFGQYSIIHQNGSNKIELTHSSGQKTVIEWDGFRAVRRQCANGTTELQQYDSEGRLHGRFLFRPRGGTPWWGTCYEYSAEGDLLEVSDSSRGTTCFEVDAAHRLVAQTLPSGIRHYYVLDAAQNLVSIPGVGSVQVDSGNRLFAAGGERFQYNDRNHLATRESADGSLLRYNYDSFDMLNRIEWTRPDGTVSKTWESAYDALGRRLWSRCGETKREFYWDGDRLAAEVLPGGHFRIYVYASFDALVPLGFTEYDRLGVDPFSGRDYYVFSDPVGMPIRIEDRQGNLVWLAEYVDPYAQVEIHQNATVEYNLRWPGHYSDPETVLHYNRYRYYDPLLGRYLQSDPLGYAGSNVNLYAYCPNPLVQVDTLGLTHPGKKGNSEANEGQEGTKQSEQDNEWTPRARQDEESPPRYGSVLADMSEGARERDERYGVTIFSDAERESHRVAANDDGQLVWNATGEPVDTGDHPAIYVMDQHGNVYAHPDPSFGEIHHSSLANGEPVAGAGEIQAVNGHPISIDDRSGHYGGNLPDGAPDRVKTELGSQGVNTTTTQTEEVQ